MKLFSLIVFMFMAASAEAAHIDVQGSLYLKQMVAEALNLLPRDFLDSVNKKITIREESFRFDIHFKENNLCKVEEGAKFGQLLKNKITISAKLVELAKNIDQEFNCGHRFFKTHLKAVIIHELTHVKDNQERISIDGDFQRIVGMKKVQRFSKKKLMNQNTYSSPDAYEFKNLEESLAVNAEYFFLDPEFECRKPATSGFLARKFNSPLKGQCLKNNKILVQSAFLEDNYFLASSIDPARIYRIHYLFAGKGRALMSRWGHAMFRLVVCAPFRKTPGPDCMEDVSHHLVLSYRAFMNNMDISYSKGVFGGYPSQLFMFRFLEIQQEYTKYELRDLYSIPLKLNKSQKIDFVNLTLERFWSYQGRYYFIDNNCGTEAVKHLDMALNTDEKDLISSATPLKIYKDIINERNSLTDISVQEMDKKQMQSRKLLIPSMFESLNENYQFVRTHFNSFSEKSFEKFVKKTNAENRLADYKLFMNSYSSLDPAYRKQVVLEMITLERYLSAKYLMEIPKKAIALMDKNLDLKKEVMKMGESLKLMTVQPWEIILARYGNPTSSELETQFPLFVARRRDSINKNMESQLLGLQSILGEKYFSQELKNLEVLKEIKSLHTIMITNVNSVF